MSANPLSADPRLERRLSSTEGLARRVSELERQVSRLSAQVGPPGRRVLWFEEPGPFPSSASPTVPTPIRTGVDVYVPGLYLVLCQFTAYVTTAGLKSKELWVNNTLLNATGQYLNTTGEHITIAMEGSFVELTGPTLNYAWTWSGTGAATDSADRGSIVFIRTS